MERPRITESRPFEDGVYQINKEVRLSGSAANVELINFIFGENSGVLSSIIRRVKQDDELVFAEKYIPDSFGNRVRFSLDTKKDPRFTPVNFIIGDDGEIKEVRYKYILDGTSDVQIVFNKNNLLKHITTEGTRETLIEKQVQYPIFIPFTQGGSQCLFVQQSCFLADAVTFSYATTYYPKDVKTSDIEVLDVAADPSAGANVNSMLKLTIPEVERYFYALYSNNQMDQIRKPLLKIKKSKTSLGQIVYTNLWE